MNSIFRVKLILSIIFLLTFVNKSAAQNGMIFPDFPFHLLFHDDTHPQARVVRPGLFNHSYPIYERYNEKLDLFAGTSDGKLYVRTLKDSIKITLDKPADNWRWDIEDALWSKDGQYLWVKQLNDSGVPTIELVTQSGDIELKPYSRAGEHIPKEQYYVVHINSGKIVQVPLRDSYPYVHGVSWNEKGDQIFFVQADRLMKELIVRRFSVTTEQSYTLFKDTAETYLIGLDLLPGYGQTFRDMAYVMIIDQGILLQSERSGYNQLYLYDKDGNLRSKLSNFGQNGILNELSGVDERNGWIYFTANDADTPLTVSLYRTSLTEDRIEKIVDSSTIVFTKWDENFEKVNVYEVKNPHLIEINSYTSEGNFIEILWSGSLEDQRAEGYQPEYLTVQLDAPGNTAQVLVLRPRDFDPEKSYPVIEYIYGGAFTNAVPNHPLDNWIWTLQDMANDGYVIVIIDSRGTPGRGKTYQDYIYGRMGQVELHDHVAVIKKLGEKYNHFDLNRVGIIGHSWGGYFSLRGMIMYPELYKAAHVSAPGVDPINFRLPVEIYMGCLPEDCPATYEVASVTNFVDKIKGPIQIIHGTADDDVPLEESYRLKQAFENYGKTNFELIELPGLDHIVMRDPTWSNYVKDFFKTNLK